ncbi:MAG: hypothetical protein NTY69_03615 [Methylococcales bacterium]|nr:hypothetical protein [Methylococcales bacterium]
MKFLNKMAVSSVMAASMLVLSTSAFAAEEHKDKNAAVLAAAQSTEASMLEAKEALVKGGDGDKVLNALNDARQSVKEFRYEQTERLRQKLNTNLKNARDEALNNQNEKSLEEINKGLTVYAEMKKIYDAAH